MCFARNAALGRYNATRSEWLGAYRAARVKASFGVKPDPANNGVIWKAELIVRARNGIDSLTIPVANRLIGKKIIDEILNEE